jgi:4,5-dihydroxyphthalate decarboxylase
LLDGDVDATAVDVSDRRLFQILENDPKIKRVFPDYLLDAKRLYQETGIYPPVHMIVMSKKLDRQHPDLAGKLYAAFEAAKRLADEDILSDRAGFSVVDLRERVLEQSRQWTDLYPHGITANKAAIDTFVSYCQEHGIVKATCTYERMFAAGTLDT